MIYVITFWDTEHVGQDLADLHKIACDEQGTETPEYSVKTYATQMEYELRKLPKEFKAYVSQEAWDQCHSSGEEETLSIARSMAWDLEPIISEYTQRIILEIRQQQK